MISVDTNVLVRIFVDDESDRAQIDHVRQLILRFDRIYISQVVQVETVWVLKSLFSFNRLKILIVLDHLLINQVFVLENKSLFEQALAIYRTSNIDFADALILATSRQQRYPLLTFDKKLIKLEGARGISE